MKRQGLSRRLQALEAAQEAVRAAVCLRDQEADIEGVLQKFRLFLRLRGVEQEPHESLATALARSLEISSPELRALLGKGIDPIHKYLTDHGVFKEIEERKAAGTWPSG